MRLPQLHQHCPLPFPCWCRHFRSYCSFARRRTCGQNFETDYEIDKEFVVKSIIEKVDNVINCVGAWQEPGVYENSQSWFSMEAVNVEWPRMLARWCKEMGVLRFVHVSMAGADLNSPSKLLRQKAMSENRRPRGVPHSYDHSPHRGLR